jgi:hypothetical protein
MAAPLIWPDSRVTLIATYPDGETAQAHFFALTQEAPEDACLRYFGQSVLLTLPLDDAGQSRECEERLRQVATTVVVDSRQRPASLRVACQLPEGAAGDELAADLSSYLMTQNCGLLLPPWSSAWQALPAHDLERVRKARRTLRRLENVNVEAWERRGMKELNRPRFPFGRDFRAQTKEINEAVQAERQRLLEEIRAEGEATVDQGVLALWEARERRVRDPQAEDKDLDARLRESKEFARRLAERLGPLPLEGRTPRPGTDSDSALAGSVTRHEQTLTCYVSFRHPHDGLPALAEWLYERGGLRVKYEFFPGSDEEDD